MFPSHDTDERVVKDGLKSIDKKVADIARAHYTQYDAIKQTLIDKLVDEADLNYEDAQKLADAIGKEFDRLIAKKKSEISQKITQKFDKAIKLKNEKLFSEALSELQSLPNRDELWAKYKEAAASRLKNIPATLFAQQANEKPVLQTFTDSKALDKESIAEMRSNILLIAGEHFSKKLNQAIDHRNRIS